MAENRALPDINGPGAQAWHIPLHAMSPVARQATIGAWFIHGAFHPCWDHWLMSIVHLRDLPGTPPARKQSPEAQYEFIIASLANEGGHDPLHPETMEILSPLDLCYQFGGMNDSDGTNDAHVRNMLTDFVRLVCEGKASPDTDYRTFWQQQVAKSVGLIGVCYEDIPAWPGDAVPLASLHE